MRSIFGGTRLMKNVAAVALAFAVVSTSACSDDDKNPTGNNNTEVGTYTLDRIDGAALPVMLFEGDLDVEGEVINVRIDATAGTMTLAANKTFTGNMTLKFTVPGAPVQSENIPVNGTYTVNGSTITLTSEEDGEVVVGTVSNGTLSFDVDLLEIGEEVSLSYKK